MLRPSFTPWVVQHIHHLGDWSDEKTNVLNENAQVCAVGADAHLNWPDAFNAIKCGKWARVGISGVNSTGIVGDPPLNLRDRLAKRVLAGSLNLKRGEPIIVAENHWVIDPDHATEWAQILKEELDPLLMSGEYDGLFLDKYGDLPYFLTQNGITPTPQDRRDWENLLKEVIVALSRECGRWGVNLYVNGGVEDDYLKCVTGVMMENVPNEWTWTSHFYDIKHYARVCGVNGIKGVVVGENGAGPNGLYRRACVALSMLFDGYFSPKTEPAKPLLIAGEQSVVGEWHPSSPRPTAPERGYPNIWKREFCSPRERIYRECKVVFDGPHWSKVEVTLPWE